MINSMKNDYDIGKICKQNAGIRAERKNNEKKNRNKQTKNHVYDSYDSNGSNTVATECYDSQCCGT